MMHGNNQLPECFMGRGEDSQAFVLVDEGYDVWLASSRGNRYSRSHERFDPDRDIEEYWDFGW